MLLSYQRLKDLVDVGIITHVSEEQINGASIDVTLGSEIFVEEPKPNAFNVKVLDYRKRDPLPGTKVTLNNGGYILKPGEFILAQSWQVFHLPDWLACEYKLKSSMARIGLNHLNAGWCDPGWNGSVLTLELVNTLRNHAIHLHVGDPIGQMVFFETQYVPKNKSYATRGRYNNDRSVTAIKP